MAKYKRYSGEFLSRKNVRWRIDILREADAAFPVTDELRFPADSPLVMEWEHTDKEETVCGSTATLRIVSPGDRTYEDLYTVTPGSVRMDVYRNDILYWSGTLDPEFYEEPYAWFNEYEVSLTFSDFGILDRCSYTLGGIRTLQELVAHALEKTGIACNGPDTRYITTSCDGKNAEGLLTDLSVRSENFYDEEGEAKTLYEMLEAILQPLALRIVQRAGTVYIHDLNGLYLLAPQREVIWTGEDQTMGTDKVANKAVVTFSPYAKAETMENTLTYDDIHSDSLINLSNSAVGSEPEYYSYYPDYSPNRDDRNLSFTLFLSRKGSGLKEIGSTARYFHIQPLLGGNESEGVAYSFCTGGHGNLIGGLPQRKLNNPEAKPRTVLMRTRRMPVQALEPADRNKYLRLGLELLLDMRYNPFTEPGDENESGNQKNLADYRFNFVQVPVSIVLYDEAGTALMYYSNRKIYNNKNLKGDLNSTTEGEWLEGAGGYDSCRLEWYSGEDRHHQSGVSGWKKNRHNIGLSIQDTYASFKRLPEGQYIPYPPKGGYLEVCVYAGIYIYEWTTKVAGSIKEAPTDWYTKIRWMLYKAPTVEVVNKNITHSSVESEDIEYSGVLNAEAKEDLKLDTVCGTSARAIASAKGVYLHSSDGVMVKTLHRAGRNTQAEQLLIGTLYSQYADRKTKLTGTAECLCTGLQSYTERGQREKKFVLMSDVQDVQADESELEIVELRPDEYKAENE